MNLVILQGRLGVDPETKTLESGATVTRFTLATTRTYNNAKGEKMQDTQWHTVQAWGKMGEIAARFCKKGNRVIVTGSINYNEYTDKEGVKRKSTEIRCEKLDIIDFPEQKSEAQISDFPEPIIEPIDGDDLPF